MITLESLELRVWVDQAEIKALLRLRWGVAEAMGARLLLSDSQRLYLGINSSLPDLTTDQRMIQAMAHPQDFIGFKGNDVYY